MTRKIKVLCFFIFVFFAVLYYGFGRAVVRPVDISEPQEAIPPNIASSSNKPMMMLVSSKDHTLFSPIYTDYEDIDGDDAIDTNYKPSYKYYGYFDSIKCYKYNKSGGRFDPHSLSVVKDGRYTCSSQYKLWSGNFLNWATMSRLDVIRKMLYGGKRYIDGKVGENGTSSITVLERANLSQDSHSFVKFYGGEDIRDYTPFRPADLIRSEGRNAGRYAGLTICSRSDEQSSRGNPTIRLAKGNQKMWDMVQGRVCSWLDERYQWFDEKMPSYYAFPERGNGGIWHEREAPWRSDAAVIYDGSGPDLYLRVRVCDPSLLGEERCQAYPATSNNNYKPYGIFQEFGTSSVASAVPRAEFGLIMGSYDNNLTAGVLRKNIEDFSNEINPLTGQFCHSAPNLCTPSKLGEKVGHGAIKAFDNIQLVGREGETDELEEEDGIDTDYRGNPDLPPEQMRDGNMPAWGNPLGEMVTQALRYFSGGSSTNPTTTSMDQKYDMPVVEWKDPFDADSINISKYGPPACRPLYVMALSSSALSFDDDSGTVFSSLPNRTSSLSQYVDWIGENEKLVGPEKGLRSVGAVDGGFGQDCTLKQLDRLSLATGVCPEYGAFKGTWQIAGSSFYGNTSKIRDVEALRNANKLPADIDKVEDALKVKTLAASLQGGVPRIEIPIPNTNPKKFVYITPESMWEGHGVLYPGALLMLRSINAGERYGTFMLSWNDRAFGADYDMDLNAYLRYDIEDDGFGGFNLKITTDVLGVTSGMTAAPGYSVMGTDRDGRYLTHTHGHISTVLRDVAGNLCKDHYFTEDDRNIENIDGLRGARGTPHRCNVSWASFDAYNVDLSHVETFKMVGVDDVLIRDPLWYAAKYGNVKSSKKNDDGSFSDLSAAELMQRIESDPYSWDQLKADGTPGSDGIPDGYVLARRPELLEAQLRKTLEALATTSNAAAAISASVLTEGAYKYGVQFDSHSVSGRIDAYRLNAKGEFSNAPVWEVGALLRQRAERDNGDSRVIFTNHGQAGLPFRWSELPEAYKSHLTDLSTNKLSADHAQIALQYIRGDQSYENPFGLRVRQDSLLGPVVNSSPWVQTRPMANWGSLEGYAEFYAEHKSRRNLLWVGANDGMLHAFDAETGEEMMAYVPGALANRLAEIPLQRGARTRIGQQDFVQGAEVKPAGNIWPYVDGSPFSADVKIDDRWHTYLFGALGRGGRGIFALDATHTNTFSEQQSQDLFKWQFTAADDMDLGYQVADVKLHISSNQATPIARLNNGKFAWILGNGQRSLTGKAALFIVYADGPDSSGSWTGRYEKFVVDAGTDNGLSTPRWEDLDGDGTADVVYAGDVKGNIWKFDISNANPALWGPAFSEQATPKTPAVPLFTATTWVDGVEMAQPITTAPEVVYMASGGVMVNVGTGNAFKQGDFGVSNVRQSVYGIWDRDYALVKPKLLVRSYTRLNDGTVVADPGAAMNWNDDVGYEGWRVDLPMGGEAILSDPSFDAGVFTFVSTRPVNAQNLCNTSPSNALYMLDPISGRPERVTQGYALIDGREILVAARDISDPKVRVVTDRRPPKAKPCTAGEAGCECVGEQCTKEEPRCGPGQRPLSVMGKSSDAAICYNVSPRLQWREIPGVRTYIASP